MKRNRVRRIYDPAKAQHKAYVRRKYAKYQATKIRTHPELERYIVEQLYNDLSPEQIAGRIRRKETRLPSVRKDAIYAYISSPFGLSVEAYRKKKRRQRRRRRTAQATLKDRVFIDKRPKYIQERRRIGDGEADFIVSGRDGKGILLTFTDRKSRAMYIERIIKVTIANVHKAFKRIRRRFPELKTITVDNDILLQKHKILEKVLKVKIYFCHAYHSWEKGTIENTNGLVRRYIPKGSGISRYSATYVRSLEAKLNDRPRKCLKYDTPNEVLERHRRRKQRK